MSTIDPRKNAQRLYGSLMHMLWVEVRRRQTPIAPHSHVNRFQLRCFTWIPWRMAVTGNKVWLILGLGTTCLMESHFQAQNNFKAPDRPRNSFTTSATVKDAGKNLVIFILFACSWRSPWCQIRFNRVSFAFFVEWGINFWAFTLDQPVGMWERATMSIPVSYLLL